MTKTITNLKRVCTPKNLCYQCIITMRCGRRGTSTKRKIRDEGLESQVRLQELNKNSQTGRSKKVYDCAHTDLRDCICYECVLQRCGAAVTGLFKLEKTRTRRRESQERLQELTKFRNRTVRKFVWRQNTGCSQCKFYCFAPSVCIICFLRKKRYVG